MMKRIIFILLLSKIFYMNALAGCGAHDHNCFHGVYPNDPRLGQIPRGDTTLYITTTYDNNTGNADVNQHVALPEDRGPFVASGSEGIAVEQTPVGNGANVIYHDQQVVQYAEGSSGGQLTSTEGQEQTTMIGNVASGTYQVGLHNYDIEESGEDATFNTTITAGGRGYFGGRSGSHIATAFDQEITLNGTLAPDGTTTATFEYTNIGFDPHAQGIYLIPSSVWNIGGIPTGSPIVRHFEFLDPMSQDGAAFNFMEHLNPLSQQAGIEFGGWMYDAGNGRYGFSLSTGDAGSVDILHPDRALSNAGRGMGDISATWHTQTDNNRFSGQDLFVNAKYGVDGYLGSPSDRISTVRKENIRVFDVGLTEPLVVAITSNGLTYGFADSRNGDTMLREPGIGDPGYDQDEFDAEDRACASCGDYDYDNNGVADFFEDSLVYDPNADATIASFQNSTNDANFASRLGQLGLNQGIKRSLRDGSFETITYLGVFGGAKRLYRAITGRSSIKNWTLGNHKNSAKFKRQMEQRGWNAKQIDEAINSGKKYSAVNNVNKGNTATRYVHPKTGRSVVRDDKTGEILHVGGDGFKY